MYGPNVALLALLTSTDMFVASTAFLQLQQLQHLRAAHVQHPLRVAELHDRAAAGSIMSERGESRAKGNNAVNQKRTVPHNVDSVEAESAYVKKEDATGDLSLMYMRVHDKPPMNHRKVKGNFNFVNWKGIPHPGGRCHSVKLTGKRSLNPDSFVTGAPETLLVHVRVVVRQTKLLIRSLRASPCT